MKIKTRLLCLMLITFVGFSYTFSSCKTGEGCPNEQQYKAKSDKDGNLSTKRGKSSLFSKKRKKKMGK